MRFGRWWAVQCDRSRIELGVHLDPRRRRTNAGVRFGPYLDVHLPFVTVSLGVNPIYAGDLDLHHNFSRGGLNGDSH